MCTTLAVRLNYLSFYDDIQWTNSFTQHELLLWCVDICYNGPPILKFKKIDIDTKTLRREGAKGVYTGEKEDGGDWRTGESVETVLQSGYEMPNVAQIS